MARGPPCGKERRKEKGERTRPDREHPGRTRGSDRLMSDRRASFKSWIPCAIRRTVGAWDEGAATVL